MAITLIVLLKLFSLLGPSALTERGTSNGNKNNKYFRFLIFCCSPKSRVTNQRFSQVRNTSALHHKCLETFFHPGLSCPQLWLIAKLHIQLERFHGSTQEREQVIFLPKEMINLKLFVFLFVCDTHTYVLLKVKSYKKCIF